MKFKAIDGPMEGTEIDLYETKHIFWEVEDKLMTWHVYNINPDQTLTYRHTRKFELKDKWEESPQ